MKGDYESGLAHFEQYGYKEGRKGSADSLPYLTPTMESLGADLHDLDPVAMHDDGIIDTRLSHLVNSKKHDHDRLQKP